MSHVNVNPGGPPISNDTVDRTGAAGTNLAASVIVLASVVAAFWFLLTDAIGAFLGGGTTNVYVNTPGDPSAQPRPSQPSSAPGLTNPGPAD